MKPDASSEQHSVARRITLGDRTFELFIERERIAAAVERIAHAITQDYTGRQLVLVVVLKGALVFAADLMRAIPLPLHVECVRASSYGSAMQSSGTVSITGSVESLTGKDVVIVEDIADSGTTLTAITAFVEEQKPRSLAVATLLSKPAVHNGRIPLQYVGIEIEPVFVVGYGLDYNEMGRNLPAIYRVVER